MRTALAVANLALVACIDPTKTDTTATSSYDDAVIHADVADTEGVETIRASIEAVTVLDARGTIVASARGFDPQGSADEVLGIRVLPDGSGGVPMFAVTTTVGGHRENTTYTAIYRVSDRSLETLFLGPIEHIDGDYVASGLLRVFPTTILYRAPGAELATMQPLGADFSTR